MKYIATTDGQEYVIAVGRDGRVSLGDTVFDVDLESIDGRSLFSLIINGVSYEVFVERQARRYYVTIAGDRYEVQVDDERMKRLRERAGVKSEEPREITITAPMPGLVVDVIVDEGERVTSGTGVVLLEAMKMENEIRAPKDGIVTSIHVSAGQTVDQGDVMVEIEAAT